MSFFASVPDACPRCDTALNQEVEKISGAQGEVLEVTVRAACPGCGYTYTDTQDGGA